MKIKFNSDDNLPLNKILKFHVLTIIIRNIFEKDGKYYPQIFLDDCLYENTAKSTTEPTAEPSPSGRSL